MESQQAQPFQENLSRENNYKEDPSAQQDQLGKESDAPVSGGHIDEITTNDGSVIETLDTAFHGEPGWSEGENLSGSNRADYYEARSNGKTDSEEELEALRERNENKGS